MITVDGIEMFPSCFSSIEYLESLDKRRMSGIRRMSRSQAKGGKKSLATTENNPNPNLSPHGLVHIPT